MVENCSDFLCSTLSLVSAIFFSVHEKKRKEKNRFYSMEMISILLLER